MTLIENITGNGKLQIKENNEITVDTANSRHLLNLKNVNLDHIEFIDTGILVLVDKTQSINNQIILNKQLAKRFEDNEHLKKKFDVSAITLTYKRDNDYISLYIRSNWDDFGYNKYLIYINSLFFIIIFFAKNWIVYPSILYHGYPIEEFIKADNKIKLLYKKGLTYEFYNAVYCFIYTLVIFWGFRLTLENLKMSNLKYVLLILFQYVVGLICLAYIANLVIVK